MAYKKLIKVSNVCQLLDKSKYPATTTSSGITFTNNGDGTYTANGIRLGNSYLYIQGPVAGNELKLTAKHKYLILNGSYTEAGRFTVWLVVNGNLVAESNKTIGANNFYIPKVDVDASVSIRVAGEMNTEVNNFVFKPQLFDLTEMYRAGNEPTTVEQFRQDFPEELYDYSPYCWLTSYKRVIVTGNETYPTLTAYRRNLTCKTKNLLSFPYYSSYKTKNGITFSQVETYKVHASGINTNSTGTAFDFVYGKTFKAGTYTIKFYTEGNTTKGIYYRLVKDSYYGPSIGDTLTSKLTFTLSVDTVLFIGFGIFGTSSPFFASEGVDVTVYCQLELGDTPTDYVPYGHL